MQTDQSPTHSVLREAHLRDYWKVVWQGRWTVLAIFAIVLGAMAVWTFLQHPIYRATATIEVLPQARRLIGSGNSDGLGAGNLGWFAEEKYHNTQIEIIKSRDVSQRVVDRLGLRAHPLFAEASDPVNVFRGMIEVTPRRDTGLLEISIGGRDRLEITNWANAVADAYVQRNLDKARANADRAIAAIGQQIDRLTETLTLAEERRIGTLETSEIFDSENQEALLRQKLTTYSTEQTAVNIELNRLDDTLERVRQLRTEGGDLLTIGEFNRDPEIQELLRNRVEVERDLEGARVQLRPGHPEYEMKTGDLRKIESKIADRTGLLLANMQNQYELALARKRYLEGEVRRIEEGSLRLAKATSRYNIVKTDAEMKKEVFDLIAMTMNEVTLSSELMNNNVSMLDEATPPLIPIKPRKKVNLIIGAMMGMFFGLAAVFFLDYLDNTIRTPEDVEKYLGLSVIGVVPKLQKQGLTQRAVKEAYQSLRTSVIFSSKNRQRKVVLITSTGPREGKSSTITNLARTLAAAGDRVIVVDCDLRKPRQHVHFGVEREPGLTNYLAAPIDDVDWSRYLKSGGPATLHLLSSGPLPPSPPELLGGGRFQRLMTDLREAYDWVLIDSPPASTLADASLLATLAEMVVLVVQHNRTDRDHVVKTVQQLRSVNSAFAGVVLNNVDLDRAYHKDYYYSGYYDDEDEGTSSSKRKVEREAQVG